MKLVTLIKSGMDRWQSRWNLGSHGHLLHGIKPNQSLIQSCLPLRGPARKGRHFRMRDCKPNVSEHMARF